MTSMTSVDAISPVGEAMSFSMAPDFCPSLPTDPFTTIYAAGANSFFMITLVGIADGFDLGEGPYPGWCLEANDAPVVGPSVEVTAWCSYDTALPANLSTLPLNELNYLINHKYGGWEEIQAAIHLLTWGSSPNRTPTANSYAMLNDALTNGADYIPGPGDLIVVLLYTGDGGIGYNEFQDTFVELRLPPDENGFESCTPGYWRTHFDRWPSDYHPFDDFDTTFGTNFFSPDITLGQAAWMGGGGLRKLARHGTAALLNAAYGGFEYPYSVDEVIAMVRDRNADPLADANDVYDCPLGGTSADPHAPRTANE